MDKKGFTLIEIMVVIAIIAVLSVMIFGAINAARRSAAETQHRSNATTLQTLLESHYTRYRVYCGGGGYTCPTAAVSFETVYDGLNGALDANYVPSTNNLTDSDQGNAGAGCNGATAPYNGGGQITSSSGSGAMTSGGWQLRPVDYTCANVMTSDTVTR